MLNRWFRSRTRDPLWDHFINQPPADPKNGLAPVLLSARGGSVYPVKTEVGDPITMSRYIKQLARWWGADLIGITTLDSSLAQEGTGTPAAKNEDSGQSPGGGPQYRFALVCAIGADYDPSVAQGLGGQVVMQNGAIVIHYLRSYIRELGYPAVIGGVDPLEAAVKAGIGSWSNDGRFITSLRRAHVQVFDPVLTNMPLAADPLPD